MQILSHPNILRHQETIVMGRKILLVTEYCELGDMQVRKVRVRASARVMYTRLTTQADRCRLLLGGSWLIRNDELGVCCDSSDAGGQEAQL